MRITLPVMSILTLMLVAACSNIERSRTFGNPEVNGKTIAQQVCSVCHGADGNATSPEYPKLAGQQPQYLVTQVRNFNHHTRTDRLAQEVMAGMSRDLTDDQLSEIAVYFYRQPLVKGISSTPLSEEGQNIYRNGIPAKSVLACIACHGPTAEGIGPFPRLAGQHASYLVKQLMVFRDTHGRPDTPMTEVSKQLTNAEIQALADYLSNL